MATSSSSARALFLAVNLVLLSYTSATPCTSKPIPKPYEPGTGSSGSSGGGIHVGVGGGNVGGIVGGGHGGGIVCGGKGCGVNVGGGGVNVGGVPGGIVGGGSSGGVGVGGIPGGIVGGGSSGGVGVGGIPGVIVGGGSKGGIGVGGGTKEGYRKCPIDTLKLGVCANILNGLIHAVIGKPPSTPCSCCTLVQGLVDLEAAICLCTAIKANILGVNLNVPVSLSLLVNYCGKKVPTGFVCP